MRFLTRVGRLIAGTPHIEKPPVADEPVRIRLDIPRRPGDREPLGYAAFYLTHREAKQVGRLVGMISESEAAVRSDSDTVCEEHPTEVWPHCAMPRLGNDCGDCCSSPGMPWQNLQNLLRLQVEADDRALGIAVDEGEAGDFIRVRVSAGDVTAIQEGLKDATFYDVTLKRDGTGIRSLDTEGVALTLRGDRPTELPVTIPSPRVGYKRVDLTYFTRDGRRYRAAEFFTPEGRSDWETYATVREMRAENRLPGLVTNQGWGGSILVTPADGTETLLGPLDE